MPKTAGKNAERIRVGRNIAMAGGISVSMRALTLFFRFILSFYIIRYLGLEAAGVYGLAAGAVGIAPAVIGLGLNYFTGREVVGQTPDQAAPLVKTRLTVTISSLAVSTVGWAIFTGVTGTTLHPISFLILALVWLETIALDIYMPLIGLELATQANVVVFVRSALWVPFVMVAGVIWPALRSVELIFVAWIVSHIFSLGLLAFFLRRWPVLHALRTPIDREWIRRRLRHSWHIYLSDLGLVGLIFIDRYIVNGLLGLKATGIYVFYWSIANALQTLMQTAVVQLALPKMLKAYREPTLDHWQALYRREMLKTIVLALGLSVAIFAMVELIVSFDASHHFPREIALLVLMLAASVIRAGSDFMNICITSCGRDRYYAFTNFAGVFVTIACSFGFITMFGLIGCGLSALTTAAVLAATRYVYLRATIRTDTAARLNGAAAA
ncbi:N/A [soil metagenome]